MFLKWFRDKTKIWINLSKDEYERYKDMYDELIQKECWYVDKIDENTITWKRIRW